VWRRTTKKRWRFHIASYVLALLAGAVILAGALAGISALLGKVEPAIVGVAAAIGAAAAAGLIPSLPSSPWRVPRSWARLGEWGYATAFGFVLGLGIVTAIPSSGFYVLMVWALSTEWATALAAFIAFALARSAPLFAALAGDPERITASAFSWRARSITTKARVLESSLLVVAAVILLL
jgi:hypothetical protein